MKKIFVICLILLFITGLCACERTTSNASVVFYYPRVTYLYDGSSGVIGEEATALSKNNLPIEKILQQYLEGPKDTDLHSPLTGHVQLKSTVLEKDTLTVTLSDRITELAPTALSSSLSALALTCFEISDINQVCIRGESVFIDGEQAVVFTKDSIMLWDSYILNPPATQAAELGE